MKIFLAVVGAIALLIGAIWLIPGDKHDLYDLEGLDLPWQVKAGPDGTSHVLGLNLGTATLADAMERFGELEGIALFLRQDESRSLEGYFGKVHFGPFEARIVTTLVADEWQLDGMAIRAAGRDRTRSGDIKLLLADADKAAMVNQPLKTLTYIPAYGGLDEDFFRARLGEPHAWREESESAVSWFYPELGLSLLINSEGKEVFEFTPPRDFRMPKDATVREI